MVLGAVGLLILAAYSFATWHARLIERHVPIPHGIFAVAWFIVGSAVAWVSHDFPATAHWFGGHYPDATTWCIIIELSIWLISSLGWCALYSHTFRSFLNSKRSLAPDYLGIPKARVSLWKLWMEMIKRNPGSSKYDLFFHAYHIHHGTRLTPGQMAARLEAVCFFALNGIASFLVRYVSCN